MVLEPFVQSVKKKKSFLLAFSFIPDGAYGVENVH